MLWNISEIFQKTPVIETFCRKVADQQSATLLKMGLYFMCFRLWILSILFLKLECDNSNFSAEITEVFQTGHPSHELVWFNASTYLHVLLKFNMLPEGIDISNKGIVSASQKYYCLCE